jgi:hypothetical protein
MCSVLYIENIKDWREKYFTVHLLMRENSIKNIINWCFSGDRIPFDSLSIMRAIVKLLNFSIEQIS